MAGVDQHRFQISYTDSASIEATNGHQACKVQPHSFPRYPKLSKSASTDCNDITWHNNSINLIAPRHPKVMRMLFSTAALSCLEIPCRHLGFGGPQASQHQLHLTHSIEKECWQRQRTKVYRTFITFITLSRVIMGASQFSIFCGWTLVKIPQKIEKAHKETRCKTEWSSSFHYETTRIQLCLCPWSRSLKRRVQKTN